MCTYIIKYVYYIILIMYYHYRNILQTHIFRIEVPVSFFNDFINMCLQYLLNVDDVESIIELLDILRKCNRFDLTLLFMSEKEQSTCQQLFQQLQLKESSQDKSKSAVESLAAKYQINLSNIV